MERVADENTVLRFDRIIKIFINIYYKLWWEERNLWEVIIYSTNFSFVFKTTALGHAPLATPRRGCRSSWSRDDPSKSTTSTTTNANGRIVGTTWRLPPTAALQCGNV
jgi:hypothetical protein